MVTPCRFSLVGLLYIVYIPCTPCLDVSYTRKEPTRKLDVLTTPRKLTVGVAGDPEGSTPR